MTLSPMRFKDYVWPHNPRTYEIRYQRDVAAHRVPFAAYTLQNMGLRQRILRGEGEFSGPGAYGEFQKLATVFYEDSPGILIHPLWDTAKAWFVALQLNQEPTENYVRYSFEFWECSQLYRSEPELLPAAGGAEPLYHTAAAGESLWTVAAGRGTTAEALLALNPQIKNPNVLSAGDRIRLR